MCLMIVKSLGKTDRIASVSHKLPLAAIARAAESVKQQLARSVGRQSKSQRKQTFPGGLWN